MNEIKKVDFWNKISSGYYPYIIIVLIGLLAYLKVTNFSYSGLDDSLLLIGNFNFMKDIANIPKAFLTDAFIQNLNSPFYRPIQTVSFIIDSQFMGDRPDIGLYHFMNLIFHLINSILVYIFLQKVQNNKYTSLLLSLIYSINPLFVHTVAWVPARGDILVSTFIFSSIIFWINYIKNYDMKHFYLSALFMLLGCFTKEVAILTPILLVFYYYITDKEGFSINKLKIPVVVWAVFVGIYFLLRNEAIKNNFYGQLFNIDNLINNLPTVFEFISKFVLGYNLSPMPMFSPFVTISGILILVGLSAYLFFYRNLDFKMIMFGILWIFVFLVPTLMYRHALGQFSYDYLEHRAYLPLLGLIFILIPVINQFMDKDENNTTKLILLLIILFFTAHTFVYSSTYKDYDKLYTRVIKTNPTSAMAYYNRGVNHRSMGRMNQAFADINKAVELHPNYVEAIIDRALMYQNSRQFDLAVNDYQRALKMVPTNLKALRGLATLTAMKGDFVNAITIFSQAIKLYPKDPSLLNNRGYAYFLAKKYDSSMIDLNLSLQIAPNFPDAFHNRGNLKFELGDKNGACQDWAQGAKLGNAGAKASFDKYCK